MKSSLACKYFVLFTSIPALYISFFPGKIGIVSALLAYPLLIIIIHFLLQFKKYNVNINKNFEDVVYFKLFVLYNIFVLLRGFIDATSEEDWTVMIIATIPLFLVIHCSFYLASSIKNIKSTIRTFFTYGVIISAIIYVVSPIQKVVFVSSMTPIYLMIFMVPYLNKKYASIVIAIVLFAFFSDFSSRSNLINIIIASIITCSYYFGHKRWMMKIMKASRIVFLCSPVFFLAIGGLGVYNIFLIGDDLPNYSLDFGKDGKQELLVDSRTAIYVDVFNELAKKDSFIFGLGASGKTETSLVDLASGNYAEVYKEGRRATESGMLNYIQWGGILGALFYFLLLWKASYLALYKSNNWFCVMLGLWVAFKGLFSFIEDRLSFSVGSVFIFFAIAICMNKNIRSMTHSKMKHFLNSIIKNTYSLKFD
jgi:hypothetical protein